MDACESTRLCVFDLTAGQRRDARQQRGRDGADAEAERGEEQQPIGARDAGEAARHRAAEQRAGHAARADQRIEALGLRDAERLAEQRPKVQERERGDQADQTYSA